jgi:hypothetical protein
MQEKKENNQIVIEDISNSSKGEPSGRTISIVFVFVALAGILFCVGLMIQALISHYPNFELLASSPFKIKHEFLGYSLFILNTIGILILMISYFISDALRLEQKNISLYLAWVGSFVIASSILPLLLDRQDWWGFIYAVSLAASVISLTFNGIQYKQSKKTSFILIAISGVSFSLLTFSPLFIHR